VAWFVQVASPQGSGSPNCVRRPVFPACSDDCGQIFSLVATSYRIHAPLTFFLIRLIPPERLAGGVLSRSTESSQLNRGLKMPDDPSLDPRASAAECLRLAASTTNPTSRASLLLLAQKWMEKANKLAARSLGQGALLPDTDKRTRAS
jgi:hypothetical protein